MSETSEIVRPLLAELPKFGCTTWRNNQGVDIDKGVRYGSGNGSADILGFTHAVGGPCYTCGYVPGAGQFFGIECKSAKGRLSKNQELWLAHVARHGGRVVVVRSLEEGLEWMREFRESLPVFPMPDDRGAK